MPKRKNSENILTPLKKSPTGIQGLDEITSGGLPAGRPTLVCGSAGAGKTLLAVEFLYRGATEFNEPGVFMSFEETADEIAKNVASLGFDLKRLVETKKLAMDFVYIERAEIQETGEYDLEGLFVRLNYAIDSVGAKRVVLDTLEALFAGIPNHAILRAELRRLFRWLKEKGVTAIITGERGENTLTRYGLEEYVADCVILLDHRVIDQVSTRRMRIVKYRGSTHGTNEYPFLVTQTGFSVLPLTSIGLTHSAPINRVSSGVPRLDTMLGGKGFFRGSTVLISGTAGTGKSTLAAYFTDAACRRGEKVIYFAFEESENQIMRNMRSVGLNLKQWVDKGLLKFHNARPTAYGLETHLAVIHQTVNEWKPKFFIADPITNLISVGNSLDTRAMVTRLIDFLKVNEITALFTSLTAGGDALEQTEVGVSSLMDTWLLVKHIEMNGERNRGIYILKSRGMAHSNQVREFILTDNGIELVDVYLGQEGVMMGAARASMEAKERTQIDRLQYEISRKEREAQAHIRRLESQIASMQDEIEEERNNLSTVAGERAIREQTQGRERYQLAKMRGADILHKSNGGRTPTHKERKR